ncbi:DegV family protein [Nonomuraea pusilla]|uniref:DegV family protein n=1 Tax=Nonomuraea pusilla TaxID=46177 RepID=UPI003327347F
MPPSVRVVTDSTAYLTDAPDVPVVPVQVISRGVAYDEGDFTGDLATATTSRPSPSRFLSCYEALAAEGATGIVSVHLSADLSGTVESARLAARDAPVPVGIVDSRTIGAGVGHAVLAAVQAAADGATLAEAAEAARRQAAATRTFFYVDTLDYLRRSGRIGTAASLFGSALMIKPLLHIADGRIALLEKVRTSGRALARLEDLAVEAAGEEPVEAVVQHLGAPERAHTLAAHLTKRLRLLAPDTAGPPQAGETAAGTAQPGEPPASPPHEGKTPRTPGGRASSDGTTQPRKAATSASSGQASDSAAATSKAGEVRDAAQAGEVLAGAAQSGEAAGTGQTREAVAGIGQVGEAAAGTGQPGEAAGGECRVVEVGAVIGAHVGPGVVAITLTLQTP